MEAEEGDGMTFVTFGDVHLTEYYRQCRCNMCDSVFSESTILVDIDTELEYCPNCNSVGCIMDLGDDECL